MQSTTLPTDFNFFFFLKIFRFLVFVQISRESNCSQKSKIQKVKKWIKCTKVIITNGAVQRKSYHQHNGSTVNSESTLLFRTNQRAKAVLNHSRYTVQEESGQRVRVIEVADPKLMGRFVSEKSKKGTENQTTLFFNF